MRKFVLSLTVMLIFLAGSLFITGCGSNAADKKPAGQTEQNHKHLKKGDQALYACPMHPEVTGKKGDKCSKCGMKLTKPVEKNDL